MGTHRFKLKGITPGDLTSSVPSGGTFSALGPLIFVDINLNNDSELPLLTNFMRSIGWEFDSSSPTGPPTLTDAGHGNRGGGTLHTIATAVTAGFLSAADKAKLDSLSAPVAAQIPSNYVQLSAPDTTISNSLVDIAGMAITVTLTDTAHIHGVMTFAARSADPGGGAIYGAWAVQINGVDGQEVQRYLSGATDDGVGAVQFRTSSPLPPGTYTIKGRFRRVSGLRTLQTFSAQLFGWGIEGGGVPTKEVLLSGTNYANDYGDFRTRSQGATGAQRYTFPVPHDFNSLISLAMVAIPRSIPSAGLNIALDSDYGALSEPLNNHTESNTVAALTSFPVANDISELDISSVFSSLAAGDRCGLFINHTGIGATVDYLMVRLRYT